MPTPEEILYGPTGQAPSLNHPPSFWWRAYPADAVGYQIYFEAPADCLKIEASRIAAAVFHCAIISAVAEQLTARPEGLQPAGPPVTVERKHEEHRGQQFIVTPYWIPAGGMKRGRNAG